MLKTLPSKMQAEQASGTNTGTNPMGSLARSTPKTVTLKVKTCGCLLHTRAVFPSVPNEKSKQYQVKKASEPTA